MWPGKRMVFGKRTSPRRNKVRQNLSAERISKIGRLFNPQVIISALLGLLFVVFCVGALGFEVIEGGRHLALIPISVVVVLITVAVGFYIYQFQRRIISNHARMLTLVVLFLVLLTGTKIGSMLTDHNELATGTAVTAAIILAIAYDQRFAFGMSIFYCMFASFAAGAQSDMRLFLIMMAGVTTCCFSLREIRTRMKLLEVSTLAAVVVFVMALSLDFLSPGRRVAAVFRLAGLHAGATFLVGLLIQSLLPLIEKAFRIATSMTLLDYSDANQPLLKRLAMEAPGTFSHSLLVGSIAETAAESIGRNGLLCRVGAYYHDIGKTNKPGYFVENEMGSTNPHKQLSPAMSQLIIVGHVKDGIEMAKEYGLPVVLRQFIETHHGTTLVEYFYDQARKKQDKARSTPSEAEFRYSGPKPSTKEAAIVMLADAAEGAVRSLAEPTPTRIEAVVHNMAMRRLQDGQFDECELSLRELSQIETSMTKALAAHYHGRISYPTSPEIPDERQVQASQAAKEGRLL